MATLARRRRVAILALLLAACGAPSAPRPEAHAEVAVRVDAGIAAADDAGTKPAQPWTLYRTYDLCWSRGATAFCVSPLSKEDPAVTSKPFRAASAKDATIWRLDGDGTVRIEPEDRGADPGSKEEAASQRELAARKAVAKQLPSLTRIAVTPQFGCGLLPKGDVTCWSEPKQNVDSDETPLVVAPALVPNAHGVRDLFLQEWSTLCVLTKEGAVMCSPRLPAKIDICVLRGTAARCGASRSVTTAAGWALSGAGFDPRTQLTRPLVAIPDVTDARVIEPYASVTYYAHSDPKIVSLGVERDGGCALDAKGTVSCWERDPCPKGADWRTQKVEGLPADIASLSLGKDDGYALDRGGRLYTWERPLDDCKAGAPKAKPMLEGVKQVLAWMFVVHQLPMIGPLACAALLDGTVRCWRDHDEKPVVIQQ